MLRVLNACQDVSADWLLRGTGEMYKTTNTTDVNSHNTTVIAQQTTILSENFVRDILAEKDKQIQTLLALLGK